MLLNCATYSVFSYCLFNIIFLCFLFSISRSWLASSELHLSELAVLWTLWAHIARARVWRAHLWSTVGTSGIGSRNDQAATSRSMVLPAPAILLAALPLRFWWRVPTTTWPSSSGVSLSHSSHGLRGWYIEVCQVLSSLGVSCVVPSIKQMLTAAAACDDLLLLVKVSSALASTTLMLWSFLLQCYYLPLLYVFFFKNWRYNSV